MDFEFYQNNQPPPPFTVEHGVTHVNGSYHMSKTWRHVRDRLDDDAAYIPWLDAPVLIGVNGDDTLILCNASANPVLRTTAFAASVDPTPTLLCGEGRCANTAYSTVISHEYGHVLLVAARPAVAVTQGFLRHAAFHEGFADSLAHLVHDTAVMGMRFCGCECVSPGQPPGCYNACPQPPVVPPPPVTANIRCPLLANIQYPDCTGSTSNLAHGHGMLLSGVWLDLLAGIRALDPIHPEVGLVITRQLHVDWFLMTNGGQDSAQACPPPVPAATGRAAHAGTLIEVLTADDNDGNLSNGTPHVEQICRAFACHNIFLPYEPSPCGAITCGDSVSVGGAGSTTGACLADCDRNGFLNAADIACFQARLASGAALADRDGGTAITVRDAAWFHAAFARGCR